MNVIGAGIVWNTSSKELVVGKWDEIKALRGFPKSLEFDAQNCTGFAREKEAIHNMYSSFIMLIAEYGFDPVKLHNSYLVIDGYAAHACGYLRMHLSLD